MMTFSLCMIVKNEERVLARCLDSAKDIFDEIIIADTGSEDRTPEIAKKYTDNVYFFAWDGSFSDARNFSFEKATGDYIMWLDADDVVLAKSAELLTSLKQELTADAVFLPYNIAFDEFGNPTVNFYRERIFRRSREFKWEGEIHEYMRLSGDIWYENIPIDHHPVSDKPSDRNLKILEELKEKGGLSPRNCYYYAQELLRCDFTEHAAVEFESFLTFSDGENEQKIHSCRLLARCYASFGQKEIQREALLRSFLYDRPRAEICCDIGKMFFLEGKWRNAIGWYEIALSLDPDDFQTAQREPQCYDVVPLSHLCACHQKLGDLRKALYYHDLTRARMPNHPAVVRNEVFLREFRGAMGRRGVTENI
jgi:glycosyltransferase involved in cell wall biosynthesis